jgi:hypothetical protein
MNMLRFLILVVLIALGTVLIEWWIVPVIGLAYGMVSRKTRWPGTVAALAGAVAWGGYLAIVGLGGAPVGAFGAGLARSMELPGWSLHLATLVFPALLAGTAAYLGARVGSRPDTKRR